MPPTRSILLVVITATLAGCASSTPATRTPGPIERQVRAASTAGEAGRVVAWRGRELVVSPFDEDIGSPTAHPLTPGATFFDDRGLLDAASLPPGTPVEVFLRSDPNGGLDEVVGVRRLSRAETHEIERRFARSPRPAI